MHAAMSYIKLTVMRGNWKGNSIIRLMQELVKILVLIMCANKILGVARFPIAFKYIAFLIAANNMNKL